MGDLLIKEEDKYRLQEALEDLMLILIKSGQMSANEISDLAYIIKEQ